jgi:predicted RNA-binding protein with PIN domain
MEKVALLDPQQRTHMRIVVEKIMQCYIEPDLHAVLVVGSDQTEQATLLTINCNEFEASLILAKLDTLFSELNMVDAPPKEMMN